VVLAPQRTAARTRSDVPAGDAMRIPLRDGSVSQDIWETLPSPFLRTTCLVVSFFVCPPPPTPTPGPAFSTSLSLWSSVLRVHVFLSLSFVATVRRPGFIVPLGPPSSSGFPNFLASILLWSSVFRAHFLWAFLRRPSASGPVYFHLRYAHHRRPRARHPPQSSLRRHCVSLPLLPSTSVGSCFPPDIFLVLSHLIMISSPHSPRLSLLLLVVLSVFVGLSLSCCFSFFSLPCPSSLSCSFSSSTSSSPFSLSPSVLCRPD
jgi:hypothetical protein